MALQLLHCSFSTCSQKVRLCLAEKRLDFVSIEIDLAAREHLTPAYLALNPNGVVPTLLHDDRPIVDSSVICEFVDETFPEPPLMGTTPMERAQVRAWMRYLEEVPTVAIRVPSFNRIFAGVFADFSDQAFARFTEDMPLRARFYREMGQAGFADERVAEALERLRQTLERAEAALDRGALAGKWLTGSRFTLADILLIPTVVRMADLGLEALWRDLRRVSDWFARIQERPSFNAAFYPGSRLGEAPAWIAADTTRQGDPASA